MNKGSKIGVVIVLVLVVLFGVGQFFASSNINSNQSTTNPLQPTTPALPTQVIVYAAQAASSTPVEDGSCFTNSVAAPYRSDAWRCTVGNVLSDPCFTIQGTNTLLCGVNPAEGPYASSLFVLNLTKSLPKPDSMAGTAPSNWAWAVQLADGTYCTPFTGTRPFTASGTVGNYSCSSSNPNESMIFGDLNASSSVWMADVGSLTMQSSSLPTLGYSAELPVATVWE
jgi:hypothetical protein